MLYGLLVLLFAVSALLDDQAGWAIWLSRQESPLVLAFGIWFFFALFGLPCLFLGSLGYWLLVRRQWNHNAGVILMSLLVGSIPCLLLLFFEISSAGFFILYLGLTAIMGWMTHQFYVRLARRRYCT